ncbi:MAG: AraC family transcriptional regulator [Lachnospiraceae bacterium]|nr:AraC family transcriptional regulator [Lachnospiraceae bacterium]
MIEQLSGTRETILFADHSSSLKLYDNVQPENYPPHWHPAFELIMPLEGPYRVLCGEEDYHLRERDILLICPSVLHELLAPPEGERLIFQLVMNIMDLRELDTITAMLSPAVLITPEHDPGIHGTLCRLVSEIRSEYEQSSSCYTTVIYAKFMEMLACIARARSELQQSEQDREGQSQKKDYMEKFFDVCSYINEHFSEDLTLEQMASLAGFSKYHFSRLFNKYMNISFYKYVNQKRINHAKTLLINQEIPVLDVALASGFSSHTAFLRMFKIHTGYTPTEFRKLYDSCFLPPETPGSVSS